MHPAPRNNNPTIDPVLLLDATTVSSVLGATVRPPARPTFKGAPWAARPDSFPFTDTAPAPTSTVLGFRFPVRDLMPGYFQDFRHHVASSPTRRLSALISTPPGSSAPSAALSVSSILPVARAVPARPTTSTTLNKPVAPPASSPATTPPPSSPPASSPPATSTNTELVSAAQRSSPAAETPAVPVYIPSRPMAKVPVVKPAPKPKMKAAPKVKAATKAPQRNAAAGAVKVAGKKAGAKSKRGKGARGSKNAGGAEGGDENADDTDDTDDTHGADEPDDPDAGPAPVLADTTNVAGPTAAAAAEPTLIFTVTNNNAARLRALRKQDAAQKKIDVAARKEKARTYNPDGPSDLLIQPGRRQRKPTKQADATEVRLPVKLTRAEQAARRNEASESVLLERTGRKRAAPAPAPTGRAAKKARN
ncbi:hypothetical protein B0H10DRAFT_2226885 [Mycena sp. CBHHK59/15]|nr:hypothetical protein B0H10DRAFT_2226885 [Mycena sp. CBHHK59/15]